MSLAAGTVCAISASTAERKSLRRRWIITFTAPHIGNYGINVVDYESVGVFCRGVIIRDLARRPSNHRAEGTLEALGARTRDEQHRAET